MVSDPSHQNDGKLHAK